MRAAETHTPTGEPPQGLTGNKMEPERQKIKLASTTWPELWLKIYDNLAGCVGKKASRLAPTQHGSIETFSVLLLLN